MSNLLDKTKYQLLVLVVCLLLISSAIIKTTYSFFLSSDVGENNIVKISDFKIEYCDNLECLNINKNIIGLDENNNHIQIYPYKTTSEALASKPYIFNITNNSNFKANINIKLMENNDYKLDEEYKDYTRLTEKYSKYLMIAINNCNNLDDETLLYRYSDLIDNNIAKNLEINNGESLTYCLWIYLDSETPNSAQSTYFVADISFDGEYLPNVN